MDGWCGGCSQVLKIRRKDPNGCGQTGFAKKLLSLLFCSLFSAEASNQRRSTGSYQRSGGETSIQVPKYKHSALSCSFIPSRLQNMSQIFCQVNSLKLCCSSSSSGSSSSSSTFPSSPPQSSTQQFLLLPNWDISRYVKYGSREERRVEYVDGH